MDTQALGERVLKAVKDHVERAFAALLPRVEALEKRAPEKGEKGDPGEPGKSLDLNAVVEMVIRGLPKPEDGKDADPAPIAAKLEADLTENIARLRNELSEELAKAVAAIPPPAKGDPGKDGESIHPDTVARMVADAVAKAISAFPVPRDGEPGRDAAHLDPLPSIDEAKSYPRGTWALHMGGLIRSVRTTDPITDSFEKSGWEVVLDGVAGVVTEQGEDPREFVVSTLLTSGVKATTQFRIPVVVDKGVWKEGGEHRQGDGVTYSGSYWIAQKDSPGRPGDADSGWRLCVKKGRDGKDGGTPTTRGPVRV